MLLIKEMDVWHFGIIHALVLRIIFCTEMIWHTFSYWFTPSARKSFSKIWSTAPFPMSYTWPSSSSSQLLLYYCYILPEIGKENLGKKSETVFKMTFQERFCADSAHFNFS